MLRRTLSCRKAGKSVIRFQSFLFCPTDRVVPAGSGRDVAMALGREPGPE